MTQATKHSNHMQRFQPYQSKYKVVWFYDLEGVERSYRFKADEASERTEKLLKRGFTLKCDPFEVKPLRRVYD